MESDFMKMADGNCKFTMLGMSYSGKTCYIAGMYMKMAVGVNGFTLVAEDETRVKLEREIRTLRKTMGQERFLEAYTG